MEGYESSVLEIVNIVYGIIVGIIGIVGLGYGVYSLWNGFTNENPQDQKKGITTLIVTVMSIVLMFLAKGPILELAGLS